MIRRNDPWDHPHQLIINDPLSSMQVPFKVHLPIQQ